MIIAQYALSEASLALAGSGASTAKKPPPKRTSVALSDAKLVPEPR